MFNFIAANQIKMTPKHYILCLKMRTTTILKNLSKTLVILKMLWYNLYTTFAQLNKNVYDRCFFYVKKYSGYPISVLF